MSETIQPVAWLVQYKDRHEFRWSKPEHLYEALACEPLYTHPVKELTDEGTELIKKFQEEREELKAEMPKVFADGKRLGIIETENRFHKAMLPTDLEIESWITEWAKDLYGSLYVEPTDHQRTMAIKMARAILRKAQEK